MPTNLEHLEAEVLQLAPAARSHLLERVLASLDVNTDVEAYWSAVADQREARLDSGELATVPMGVAMERLRAKLA